MQFENVKVGDLLAVFHFGNFSKKVKISKITKTWIVTDNGEKFSKKDGYQIRYSGYGHPHLLEITEVLEKELEYKELCLTLQSVKWSKLTLEELQAIKAVLDAHESKLKT